MSIFLDYRDDDLFSHSFYLVFPCSLATQSIFSCVLFSFFLGCTTSTPELFTVERDGDDILLIVICSDFIDYLIEGSSSPDFLSELLER